MIGKRVAAVGTILLLATAACQTPAPPPGALPRPAQGVEARPLARTAPTPAVDASPGYRAAQNLYEKGEYREALRRFESYLASARPDDTLAPNAAFGAGLSLFELGRFREAAHAFALVADRWPTGAVATAALIDLGVCRYHLAEFAEAKRIFRQAAQRVGRSGDRAYVAYYQARMAESAGAHHEAALRYIDADALAEDEALVALAHQRVERLFHNFLSETQLLGFTESFAGRWPSRLAFDELIILYRRTGQEAKRAEAERRHAMQFSRSGGGVRSGGDLGNENRQSRAPKIGIALPISGPQADAGRRVIQGIQLATNDFHELIRATGLSVVMKDTGAAPVMAETAVRELAADPDTIALLGPVYSSSLAAVTGLLYDYRIPALSPSAAQEGLAAASSRVFRNALLDSVEAKKIARLAIDIMGITRFAVIYPDDPAGRHLTASFRLAVEERGGELVAVEGYGADQTDFKPQIKAIGGQSDDAMRNEILAMTEDHPQMSVAAINKTLADRYAGRAATPQIFTYDKLPLNKRNFLPGLVRHYEAVFVIGPADKTALLLPQLAFYNLKGLTRFVSRAANDPAFVEIAERYAEGTIMVDGFFADAASPAVRAFARNYRVAFREEPDGLAAQAYDAMRMLLAAVAHGARSRGEMTAYLAGLTAFPGVSGQTTMTPTGDADKDVFYLTIRDGAVAEALPEELAAARRYEPITLPLKPKAATGETTP
jgi:ABC-type branched-subunit amino acid transport system substrate-binding protein